MEEYESRYEPEEEQEVEGQEIEEQYYPPSEYEVLDVESKEETPYGQMKQEVEEWEARKKETSELPTGPLRKRYQRMLKEREVEERKERRAKKGTRWDVEPPKIFEPKKDIHEELERIKKELKEKVKKPHKPVKPRKMALEEFLEETDTPTGCKIIFIFYYKSENRPPGKGIGEKRETGRRFHRLAKVKDWRRKLDNYWKAPFSLDGKYWNTVEHYYQSRKFDNHPDFATQFSVDSGSALSADPYMARAAGDKYGKFRGKRIRPEGIEADPSFFRKGNQTNILTLASYAKFSQNKHLYILLDDTENACLYHQQRGKKPERYFWLENVRETLRELKEKEQEPPKMNRTDVPV